MSTVKAIYGGHFRKICSCGNVISQCRCISEDKKETIVENGCKECLAKDMGITGSIPVASIGGATP